MSSRAGPSVAIARTDELLCIMNGVFRTRLGMTPRPWAAWIAPLSMAALSVGVFLAPPAVAGEWVKTDQTAVRLIAAARATGAGKAVTAGLHFRLQDGWKIYWRSPGDAGFPPQLDWSGSRNAAAVRLSWPAPERFSILGFETIGYTGEVVLPIAATLAEAGQPLHLRTRLRYLTCKDICIPYETRLALDIPAGPAEPSAFVHLINRYAVRVPGGGGHGLAIERAEVLGDGEEVLLRLTATARRPFAAPDVFVEGPEDLEYRPPRVSLGGGGRRAVLEVPVIGAGETEASLAGTRMTFTLVDGQRSAERTLTVAEAPGAGASFLLVLGLALLGGLILNCMPCVLPVLSIKILGVIGHGGGERNSVRLGFVASAGGILFAFLVLAGALVGLKAGGTTVGWGTQFQHPWFLVAMTLVIVLFACNLLGLFEFRLPRWIADAGERAGRVQGLGGSFVTGAFATLLATPCSAPFLGTAVGFALSRGAAEIVAVFAALGLGLALPYLVVAAVPGLAVALPGPGPWMRVLRRILGFALSATAVWLLTVLAAQVGNPAAAAVGALMATAGGLLYLRRRIPRRLGRAAGWALLVPATLAFAVPGQLGRDSRAPDAERALADGEPRIEAPWVPFDEGAIGGLVAAGKTVFVHVTANWCITCQANKTLVLLRGEVFRRLGGQDVVAMQADWTHPDDAIARYLGGFGRYGIPFDAVYGLAVPRGVALPELLSEGTVLRALDRAQTGDMGAAQDAAR